MTKKDYELIAKAIETSGSMYFNQNEAEKVSAMIEFAYSIATSLKEDNPRFDRVRFLEACGIVVEA
jgi:hypothetical protein